MTASKPTAAELFSGNTYDTPEETRHYIGDRLFLHSRWYFYLRFASVIFRSRRMASKGKLDATALAEKSFEVFRDIEGCGGRFHIKGLDNLRKSNDPLVVVSNHMSTMETVIFPTLLIPFRPTTFVVKKKLISGPVFGPVMRTLDPIAVGRTNPREDFRAVLDGGAKILESGRSLVIFPQSTRVQGFHADQFNSLGVKLAKKVGVQILATAIKTDWWGDSTVIRGFGPLYREKSIHVHFDDPMPIYGSGRDEQKKITDFIGGHIRSWGM